MSKLREKISALANHVHGMIALGEEVLAELPELQKQVEELEPKEKMLDRVSSELEGKIARNSLLDKTYSELRDKFNSLKKLVETEVK